MVVFLIPSLLCASEVILKSGQKMEGKIIEQTDKYIKLDAGVGVVMTYYADEIDTVDGQKLSALVKHQEGRLNQSQAIESSSTILDKETVLNDIKESFYNHDFQKAFGLAQQALDNCGNSENQTCLSILDYYLQSGNDLLNDLDDAADYEAINQYAQKFVSHLEKKDDLIGLVDKLVSSGGNQLPGIEDYDRRIFYGYELLVYCYALHNDMQQAKAYADRWRKYDEIFYHRYKNVRSFNFNDSTSDGNLVMGYEIFENPQLTPLLKAILLLKPRISRIAGIMIGLEHLYVNFNIDAGSSQVLNSIKGNINLVRNEILNPTLEDNITPNLFGVYLDLLKSKPRAYIKDNFNLSNSEAFKLQFLCNFHSLIGYLILSAKGVDVRAVSTLDMKTFDSLFSIQKNGFWNMFGFRKTSKVISKCTGHVLLLVKLDEKKFVFVDFVNCWVSTPFSMKDDYNDYGNGYFEIYPYDQVKDLYKNFRIQNSLGVMANLYSNLAFFALGQQDDHSAENFLSVAQSYDLSNEDVELNMASLGLNRKKLEKAIEYSEKALELYKENALAYLDLGIANQALNNFPTAMGAYKQAFNIDDEILSRMGVEDQPGWNEIKAALKRGL